MNSWIARKPSDANSDDAATPRPPEKVKTKKIYETFGYNASTGEYGDMYEMGIIDPVKVVRSALENASSAATMMLTIGCAMIEEDQTASGKNDSF